MLPHVLEEKKMTGCRKSSNDDFTFYAILGIQQLWWNCNMKRMSRYKLIGAIILKIYIWSMTNKNDKNEKYFKNGVYNKLLCNTFFIKCLILNSFS